MFRLIRGILLLMLLIVIAIGSVTIPIGNKTLWQHLRAIAGSEESQELVDGVKEKAGEVLHRTDASREKTPLDGVTSQDQERLRRLIRGKFDR